jgi:hypothetical protein
MAVSLPGGAELLGRPSRLDTVTGGASISSD